MSVKYLSVKEVSEYLGVSVMSVNRWLKSGKLVGYKFGKSVRISEEDFERFIKNNRIDNREKSDFSTGKSVLKHWGTWAGPKEEYYKIIKAIEESRSDADF